MWQVIFVYRDHMFSLPSLSLAVIWISCAVMITCCQVIVILWWSSHPSWAATSSTKLRLALHQKTSINEKKCKSLALVFGVLLARPQKLPREHTCFNINLQKLCEYWSSVVIITIEQCAHTHNNIRVACTTTSRQYSTVYSSHVTQLLEKFCHCKLNSSCSCAVKSYLNFQVFTLPLLLPYLTQ